MIRFQAHYTRGEHFFSSTSITIRVMCLDFPLYEILMFLVGNSLDINCMSLRT